MKNSSNKKKQSIDKRDERILAYAKKNPGFINQGKWGNAIVDALKRHSNSDKPCPFCGKEVEEGSKYFSLKNSGVKDLEDRIAHDKCGWENSPVKDYKGKIYS